MSPGVPPPPRPVPRLTSHPRPSPPRPGLGPTPQVPFTSYLTQVPPLADPAGFLWRGCPSHAVGTSRKMTRVVPGQAARISCHRCHGAHDRVTLHPSWRGFRHAVIRPAPAAWPRGAGVTAGVTRQAAGAHHWPQKTPQDRTGNRIEARHGQLEPNAAAPNNTNAASMPHEPSRRTPARCGITRVAEVCAAFHGSREFSRTGRRSRTAAASSSSSQNAHDQNAHDRRKHVPPAEPLPPARRRPPRLTGASYAKHHA